MTKCLLTLAGLAVGFVVPALAQEKMPACDGPPDLCQQIEALGKAYSAAENNRDMSAVLALYTDDAVWMPEGPALYGKEAIRGFFDGLFKANLSNSVITVRQVRAMGDMAWGVGDWSNDGPGPNNNIQHYHGHWGIVYARSGNTWKIRMATTNLIENEASGR
jgi:uncharacterized protein (TIGR02246 family)